MNKVSIQFIFGTIFTKIALVIQGIYNTSELPMYNYMSDMT